MNERCLHGLAAALYLHSRDLVTVFNGVTTLGWDEARALQLKAWKGGRSNDLYSPDGDGRFTGLGPNASW